MTVRIWSCFETVFIAHIPRIWTHRRMSSCRALKTSEMTISFPLCDSYQSDHHEQMPHYFPGFPPSQGRQAALQQWRQSLVKHQAGVGLDISLWFGTVHWHRDFSQASSLRCLEAFSRCGPRDGGLFHVSNGQQ